MRQRLTNVLVTLAVFAILQSVGIAKDNEQDAQPDRAAYRGWFDTFQVHALGLWYPDGAGEVQPGRDTVTFDSALAPGLSLELAHQYPDRRLGLGFGARLARVGFRHHTAVYGGHPPWGWVHSATTTYTMVEPFISVEFGSKDRSARLIRFAGQAGFHSLVASDAVPNDLSGIAISLEIGYCPSAKGRSRTQLDLSFRGSVVLPNGAREDPMFVVSLGIGIMQRLK